MKVVEPGWITVADVGIAYHASTFGMWGPVALRRAREVQESVRCDVGAASRVLG